MDDIYRKTAKLISDSSYMTVLTGAGISAESGIPTFRGKEGLWRRYRAEELATPQAFKRNPDIVWQWYIMRMKLIKKAKPNIAHKVLAKWEENNILKTLITQNVDGLHERAGSKKVLELHGNIWRIRCINCGKIDRVKKIPRTIPHCKKCNSITRPDVVWFGENLDPNILYKAYDEARRSDVMLVIGTSGVVYPAAHLPLIVKENKGIIIEINPEDTYLTGYMDIVIRGSASEALNKLDKLLFK
jgi:NAD-dependent deacetylase